MTIIDPARDLEPPRPLRRRRRPPRRRRLRRRPPGLQPRRRPAPRRRRLSRPTRDEVADVVALRARRRPARRRPVDRPQRRPARRSLEARSCSRRSGMRRRRDRPAAPDRPRRRRRRCGRTSSTPPRRTASIALHGSSPDVGVAGYSLGGGMGWLARTHGLQANSLTAIELVTADGELVRTDARPRPGAVLGAARRRRQLRRRHRARVPRSTRCARSTPAS